MNKKELRKELELVLAKTIEGILKNKNAEASIKIRKTTYSASKNIAKKFYKSIKVTAAPRKKIVKSILLDKESHLTKKTVKKIKPVIKKASAKSKK